MLSGHKVDSVALRNGFLPPPPPPPYSSCVCVCVCVCVCAHAEVKLSLQKRTFQRLQSCHWRERETHTHTQMQKGALCSNKTLKLPFSYRAVDGQYRHRDRWQASLAHGLAEAGTAGAACPVRWPRQCREPHASLLFPHTSVLFHAATIPIAMSSFHTG